MNLIRITTIFTIALASCFALAQDTRPNAKETEETNLPLRNIFVCYENKQPVTTFAFYSDGAYFEQEYSKGNSESTTTVKALRTGSYTRNGNKFTTKQYGFLDFNGWANNLKQLEVVFEITQKNNNYQIQLIEQVRDGVRKTLSVQIGEQCIDAITMPHTKNQALQFRKLIAENRFFVNARPTPESVKQDRDTTPITQHAQTPITLRPQSSTDAFWKSNAGNALKNLRESLNKVDAKGSNEATVKQIYVESALEIYQSLAQEAGKRKTQDRCAEVAFLIESDLKNYWHRSFRDAEKTARAYPQAAVVRWTGLGNLIEAQIIGKFSSCPAAYN